MQSTPFSLNRIERVNTLLDQRLPPTSEDPEQLHQAMRYVVCQGGKRIRPLLVYATGDGLNAPLEELDRAACAIELIHAYSLTHDDLPAMDDDDLRRGQPSCHKAFDEATAILVGDALQSLAFEILSEGQSLHQLAMINLLAKASGSRGMVGGQSLDLLATNLQLNQHQLARIHQLKTGALIVASIQLAALAAPHCDPALLAQLTTLAEKLGLAYQLQDDIFDHQEKKADKLQPCFISTLGLEKAQLLLTDLRESLSCEFSSLWSLMPELNSATQNITSRLY